MRCGGRERFEDRLDHETQPREVFSSEDEFKHGLSFSGQRRSSYTDCSPRANLLQFEAGEAVQRFKLLKAPSTVFGVLTTSKGGWQTIGMKSPTVPMDMDPGLATIVGGA